MSDVLHVPRDILTDRLSFEPRRDLTGSNLSHFELFSRAYERPFLISVMILRANQSKSDL